MFYIGVDLGTSAVKLLLMNEKGEIRKITSREYPLYMTDNGWSEQSPEDWWIKTAEALRELTGSLSEDELSELKAISFSGQMHGLVTLDSNDSVIRRAILWNDQRTQLQCDYLNNDVGRGKLIDYTANVALTGFTAPKILWIKDNEPQNFSKISKIMLPKDYLAFRLSGIHATDYSDASGMLLLDVEHKAWSKEMIELIGISESMLPKLFNSYESVGYVTEEASKETGLPTGVKVVIGGGDQAVGAVGTGTVSSNMCSVSIGTSGVVFVASDNFKVDYGTSALHSFCHATGKYHMMGVTLAAAASNKWWVEDILNDDYTVAQSGIIEKGIENLGNNHVYFLPYLTGERTPHNDPNARGAFVGMTTTTTRYQMTQAVMEGVTFSLRDILEIVRSLGVNVTYARIIGGGAKSALWCQMTADILNARVERINSSEGPALGAAILACVGDGAYNSINEACGNIIKTTDAYEPNPDAVKLYDERYRVYIRLYRDLKETFKTL